MYQKIFSKQLVMKLLSLVLSWNINGAAGFSVTRVPGYGIAQNPFPLDVLSIRTLPILVTASKSSHLPSFAKKLFFAP